MESELKWQLVAYHHTHCQALTQIWRTSMQAAIGIAPIHEFESQAYFLSDILTKTYQIKVALIGDEPAGFIAFNEDEINQLYIHQDHQGQGIGRALIDEAKSYAVAARGLHAGLSVRTFDVNQGARAFYQALGFEERAGNTNNEEGLLDLELIWSAQ